MRSEILIFDVREDAVPRRVSNSVGMRSEISIFDVREDAVPRRVSVVDAGKLDTLEDNDRRL